MINFYTKFDFLSLNLILIHLTLLIVLKILFEYRTYQILKS